MEWKLMLATFGSIFLAELGDKTQLATLLFSTQSKSPVMVFIGSALALVVSSLLAVIAGQFLANCMPQRLIKGLAGAGFVIIGIWLLYGLTQKCEV